MSHDTISNILKKIIGLDVTTIGRSSIKRAVDHRLRQTGLPDAESYIAKLQSSDQELKALIEEVVVPETWFFRDSAPFTALRNYITDEWTARGSTDTLRILSMPCSTGEEPYSIGMVLLDCGMTQSRVQIDAVDVSSRALSKAKLAIYTKNSFRGGDVSYRDRHFRQTDKGFELSERVTDMVHFSQGNVLSGSFMSRQEPYDVIFCRNLFIYFDRNTQRAVIRKLHNLLQIGGLLFVGHSESSIIPGDSFEPITVRGSFGYRKRDPQAVVEKVVTIPPPSTPAKTRTRNRIKQRELPLKPVPADALPKANSDVLTEAVETDHLQRARQLANEGLLDEAAMLCEEKLKLDDACSEAYYLWGVVREAMGDRKGANELFRKTIYLDPNHHEALIHLALQAENQGDKKAAEGLKKRVARTAQMKRDD